jgi:hypothetical protein
MAKELCFSLAGAEYAAALGRGAVRTEYNNIKIPKRKYYR